MTDWKVELIRELEHREQEYRDREDGDDYWIGVANGLSEAVDLIHEAERKDAAGDVTDAGGEA